MKTWVMAGLSLALGVTPAVAQSARWSVAFNAGSDIALTGDVHAGGSGRVLGLPTTVESRTYGDIYGSPFTWSVDFGYLATGSGEVRARVFRTAGEAERVQVGDVATLPLFAEFDAYTALGVDFGYRQYFTSEGSRVRPFGGASFGFAQIDEINSTFSVPAVSVVLPDVPMYDATTVPTFAISAGVLIPIGAHAGIQGGVDFRWHGKMDPVDGLAGTGLEAINDDASRWSMPLTIGAVVRF
jgi:hypothetical protein